MRTPQIVGGWVVCALITTAGLAMPADIDPCRGAAEIVISGGTRGNVPFPHHRHQDNLGECNICHAVFPQEKGAIGTLKARGTLKPKEVMTQQCTACHKEKKRAGEKTGPTACTACHKKR